MGCRATTISSASSYGFNKGIVSSLAIQDPLRFGFVFVCRSRAPMNLELTSYHGVSCDDNIISIVLWIQQRDSVKPGHPRSVEVWFRIRLQVQSADESRAHILPWGFVRRHHHQHHLLDPTTLSNRISSAKIYSHALLLERFLWTCLCGSEERQGTIAGKGNFESYITTSTDS